MTAILARRTPIRLERPAAARANDRPHCPPLHEPEVRIPPRIPARIRAEPLALPSRHLHDRRTARLARRPVRQRMAAAVRLHRVHRQSKLSRDCAISHTLAPQRIHAQFFFLRHFDCPFREGTDTRCPFHTPLLLKGQEKLISAQKKTAVSNLLLTAVFAICRQANSLLKIPAEAEPESRVSIHFHLHFPTMPRSASASFMNQSKYAV